MPLGGAIIPYVVDPKDLATAVGVQVLNTKAIGIRFAETCVALEDDPERADLSAGKAQL